VSALAEVAEMPRIALPPDLREILVEALAHALVTEYRHRHNLDAGKDTMPGKTLTPVD
jgi:hypothetical protein